MIKSLTLMCVHLPDNFQAIFLHTYCLCVDKNTVLFEHLFQLGTELGTLAFVVFQVAQVCENSCISFTLKLPPSQS